MGTLLDRRPALLPRSRPSRRRVVTLICDHGAKYLSKMFNDHWMIDQGFIKRERMTTSAT